jgi:hypothetical protein
LSFFFLGEFDGPLCTEASLRQDYQKGIYMGITFCLFAMPMLSVTGPSNACSNAEEIDGKQEEDLVDGDQELLPRVVQQRLIDGLRDYIDYQ